MNWLLNRLKEPSTWRGLIYVISGISGVSLSADVATAIVAAGIAVAGVIDTLKKDALSPDV